MAVIVGEKEWLVLIADWLGRWLFDWLLRHSMSNDLLSFFDLRYYLCNWLLCICSSIGNRRGES